MSGRRPKRRSGLGQPFCAALPAVLALLSLKSAAAEPTRPAGVCPQPLWGCQPQASERERGVTLPGPSPARYAALLSAARAAAGTLRPGMSGDFAAAERLLAEAARLLPDTPDAHSLLGQLHLEQGQLEKAAAALHRAEALAEQNAAGERPAPLERSDPQLALALGLLSALSGDLGGALERYLRLLRLGVPNHRLLYRTGDVLMALGRLDEATALLERACLQLQRPPEVPSIDVPRACSSYLVALDRGERARAAAALRRVRMLDRDLRGLRYRDFLTDWEREYHLALLLPPSCERLQALSRYLAGGRSAAPLSYLRRAETHLRALATLGCSPS